MCSVVCQYCGSKFDVPPSYLKKGRGKYCSRDCYLKDRFGSGNCQLCGKPSKFRFCSDKCREDYWHRNDYRLIKKNHYWDKKEALLKELGGKCSVCGFDDIRALDIHHINGETKNKAKNGKWSWQRRFHDWNLNKGNLVLMCANCHRIHTWKERNYGRNPVKNRKQWALQNSSQAHSRRSRQAR